MLGFLGIHFQVSFLALCFDSSLLASPSCSGSLPYVLRLLLFWPSLGFSRPFLPYSLLCDLVESQFLRDGVLPPGRASSVGVLVAPFPWFPFLSPSMGVFLVCSDLSPCFLSVLVTSAAEGFHCSLYTSLRCRLAFPSPLPLFLFLFMRLSLSSSGFPGSLFSRRSFYCSLSILYLFTFIVYFISYVFIQLLGRDSGKFSRLSPSGLQLQFFIASSAVAPGVVVHPLWSAVTWGSHRLPAPI